MQSPPSYLFLLFFVSLWLVVTTLLSVMSGWFSLARRYPDQKENPVLIVRNQSGSMGMGVRLNHVLSLSICRSGLRIGIMRIFGPFCRDLFIPWSELSIERRRFYFMPSADLRFGNPTNGHVIIPAHLANRLARASGENWPEKALPLPAKGNETLRYSFYYWLLGTTVGAVFFLIVPRLVGPTDIGPPWWIAIGFPAFIFGIVAVHRYRNSV